MDTIDIDKCMTLDAVGPVTVARFAYEVVLSGHLADALGYTLSEVVSDPQRGKLLVNFTNVKSVSSLILAKLVHINRKTEAANGRFALCNLRPEIHEILDVTRLTHVLLIYATEEEALASF